jgi:hypothetical protein
MRKWLVTVWGQIPFCEPIHEMVSVNIELEDDKTPLDWFQDSPKVYQRSEFTPHALVNFWEIYEKK